MSHWSSALPIERPLRRTLTAPGSLSARLAARHPGFGVRLLRQAPGRTLPDEARALSAMSSSRAVVRDVLLVAGEVPLVFAHSVVSARGLRRAWRALGGLGQRPLADLLYADARVRRSPLTFARLAPVDPLARRLRRWLPEAPLPRWARRSVFVRHGVPLLVTEVFLAPPRREGAHA